MYLSLPQTISPGLLITLHVGICCSHVLNTSIANPHRDGFPWSRQTVKIARPMLQRHQGSMQVRGEVAPLKQQIWQKIKKTVGQNNKTINENDHIAVFKWVKSNTLLRGWPIHLQLSPKPPPPTHTHTMWLHSYGAGSCQTRQLFLDRIIHPQRL